jgi:hypothetical protein
VSGNGKSFSTFSFYASGDSRTYCHTYPDGTPILAVHAGTTSVSISVSGRNADEAAVDFARALLRDVQMFAAEVERLHAAQLEDGNAKADDTAA